jgi:hypothetical protein
MTDYTITTDFGAKDSLPSGNAAKVIKGSEFTTEFTNIKTAVNSKADTAGDIFTGAVTFDAAVTLNADVTFDTNTMFVDVSENRVGIGNVAPATALDVTGVITTDGLTSSAGIDITGTVTASGLTVDTDTLHVDATNDRVGIGTTGPANTLTVGALEASSIYADATVGIKCDTNHKGIILQENSGAEQWSMGVNADGDLNFYDSAVTDPLVTFQDNSGNVGIGTSSPATSLTVAGSYANGIELDRNGADNTQSCRLFFDSTTNGYSIFNNGGALAFCTGAVPNSTSGTEKIRIDSSGNLLVGKTASSLSTTGIQLQNDGLLRATRSGADVLQLNRQSTDGAIVNFYKDGGTPVGVIGTINNEIYIQSGDVGLQFDASGNDIVPYGGGFQDATIDLGSSANRFKDLYRSGSTYSTSDRNKKQDIRDLTDAEARVAVVAKGSLKAFRYIDTVEAEGDDANIHFGIIAQDLKAAFEAEGLNADSYQVLKTSTYTDDDGVEQTTYSVCYENLLAFIISAI